MPWSRRKERTLPIRVENGITLDELVARVSEYRQRPLRVREEPALASPHYVLSGMWLNTETEDVILHAPSDSALHRLQFILHELAHVLLGHDGVKPDGDSSLRRLPAPSDNDERAAEELADYLASMMRHRPASAFERVFG